MLKIKHSPERRTVSASNLSSGIFDGEHVSSTIIIFCEISFPGRDEREPLNSPMDIDSMKKPLSVEYDGRSVHARSGDLIGKNSSV